MESESDFKPKDLFKSSEADSLYVLCVSSQTFSSDEKDSVLNQIASGFSQIGAPFLSKQDELINTLKTQSFDKFNFDQEYKIAYKNGIDFDFEILINSKYKSFHDGLINFFKSTHKRKCLIVTTTDFNSFGDIHLQDASFSYDDLAILVNDEEMKKTIKEANSKTTLYMNAKLFENNKNWKNLEKTISAELVGLKPSQAVQHPQLSECFDRFFNSKPIDQIIEASKFTGTLRINKPVLYIFPGRNGDSAFFTLNGYSMLINGGYERVRPCFWKFVTMLQQIDSILITHPDSDSLGGLSSFFSKKVSNPDIKPTVLTVLGNLIGSKQVPHAEEAANLIVNEISNSKPSNLSDVDSILDAIEKLKIKLVPLVKNDIVSSKISSAPSSKYDHVNLYYKLGQGSLDLYVLSPFANSADYKEFVNQQQNRFTKSINQKSHLSVQQYFRNIPLAHVTSAVVLLVWLPSSRQSANPNDNNALRLLFTGNAPQHVIASAIEKVKDFDVLLSPVYKQKSEEKMANGGAKKPANPAPTNGVKSKPPQPAQSHDNPTVAASTASAKTRVSNAHSISKDSKPVGQANAEKASSANSAAKPPKAAASSQSSSGASANSKEVKETKEAVTVKKHESTLIKKKPAAAAAPANKEETNESKPLSIEMSEEKKEEKKPAVKSTTVKKDEKTANNVRASISDSNSAKAEAAKTTAKPTAAPLPKAPKPAAAVAPKEQATAKKPLSGAAKPAEQPKKEPESKIITKRDHKSTSSVKPPVSESPKSEAKEANVSLNSKSTEPVVVKEEIAPKEEAPIKIENIRIEESLAKSQEPANLELNNSFENFADNQTHENGVSSHSPNLSPVKKDVNGQTLVDVADAELYDEQQNNSMSAEPSQPQNDQVKEFNSDVMTRSFIEDAANPQSNPFAAESSVKNNLNESENDLNKTHQLSDEDEAQNVNGENLVGAIESLSIDSKINSPLVDINGQTAITNDAENLKQNDPTTWNLLELPKPVNPVDSETVETAASITNVTEKKATPNGKKAINVSSSPSLQNNESSVAPKGVSKNLASVIQKPNKSAPIHPIYVEVSYIPAHGNGHYCDSDFFKRVRARHYVLSAEEPSEQIFNALVAGKETWEDKNLQVTLIPTYESEAIRNWFVQNEEKLASLKIDVLPAANTATLTMDENPELSCQVLKLEF